MQRKACCLNRVFIQGKVWALKSPETSVRNYQYLLSTNPEQRNSHGLRGGRLKSHSVIVVLLKYSVTFQINIHLLMLFQHRVLCRVEFENDRE
jgi:hypothetical protein